MLYPYGSSVESLFFFFFFTISEPEHLRADHGARARPFYGWKQSCVRMRGRGVWWGVFPRKGGCTCGYVLAQRPEVVPRVRRCKRAQSPEVGLSSPAVAGYGGFPAELRAGW